MKNDIVNHPSHYCNYPMESIELMQVIWGKEMVATWCEMNAFKYRMRMGTKEGAPIEQDFAKEQWYLRKCRELREEVQKEQADNAEIFYVSGSGK